MKQYQKGFGAVEAIIIILIAGLIGFGGWFVWQKQQKDNVQPTTNNSGQSENVQKTANPYTSWKTYDDGTVSFKYPNTWSVAPSANPTGSVEAQAPADPAIRLVDESGQPQQYENMRLTMSITPHPSFEGSRDCDDGCRVVEVLPINNPDLQEGKLVIADGNGGVGHPLYLTVVDDPAIQKGNDKYRHGITAKGAVRSIGANVMFDDQQGRMSFGWIANLSEFQQTTSYKDMLNVINTISFEN